MVIFPWVIKFVKKNWKKIILTIVGLVAFCYVCRIVIILSIYGIIPVKQIGMIETYEKRSGRSYRDYYEAGTVEEFLEHLETWEESGYSLEDIETLKEELQRYEGKNILVLWCKRPMRYLVYCRDDSCKRTYGYYIYQEEENTKLYIYITKYRQNVYNSPYYEW